MFVMDEDAVAADRPRQSLACTMLVEPAVADIVHGDAPHGMEARREVRAGSNPARRMADPAAMPVGQGASTRGSRGPPEPCQVVGRAIGEAEARREPGGCGQAGEIAARPVGGDLVAHRGWSGSTAWLQPGKAGAMARQKASMEKTSGRRDRRSARPRRRTPPPGSRGLLPRRANAARRRSRAASGASAVRRARPPPPAPGRRGFRARRCRARTGHRPRRCGGSASSAHRPRQAASRPPRPSSW